MLLFLFRRIIFNCIFQNTYITIRQMCLVFYIWKEPSPHISACFPHIFLKTYRLVCRLYSFVCVYHNTPYALNSHDYKLSCRKFKAQRKSLWAMVISRSRCLQIQLLDSAALPPVLFATHKGLEVLLSCILSFRLSMLSLFWWVRWVILAYHPYIFPRILSTD